MLKFPTGFTPDVLRDVWLKCRHGTGAVGYSGAATRMSSSARCGATAWWLASPSLPWRLGVPWSAPLSQRAWGSGMVCLLDATRPWLRPCVGERMSRYGSQPKPTGVEIEIIKSCGDLNKMGVILRVGRVTYPSSRGPLSSVALHLTQRLHLPAYGRYRKNLTSIESGADLTFWGVLS